MARLAELIGRQLTGNGWWRAGPVRSHGVLVRCCGRGPVCPALWSWRRSTSACSDQGDGTLINRDHRARGEGHGGGEQECGSSAELLGLAVSAQRDVLRLAGALAVAGTGADQC